jgi:hypothetical protein
MQVTEALKSAVHQVLVEMAIDDELSGDINDLCVDTLFEKAEQKLKDSDFTRLHEIEAIGEYIIPDADEGETLSSCYQRLKDEQTKGNGDKNVDYYVTPVERYEYSFTVDELLDLIKP